MYGHILGRVEYRMRDLAECDLCDLLLFFTACPDAQQQQRKGETENANHFFHNSTSVYFMEKFSSRFMSFSKTTTA
ncbi:hypothetical protein SDC9_203844 [bioreactor metagenome]|uniref:Uncharacterized protein n=1 Tax=bioreactor metagenome TaxID=1076179 RepID=A0A645IXL8_9ZZZZ